MKIDEEKGRKMKEYFMVDHKQIKWKTVEVEFKGEEDSSSRSGSNSKKTTTVSVRGVILDSIKMEFMYL